MQQSVAAAAPQAPPINLVPAGAYSLPQPPPPTAYPYGFFPGMPAAFPQQQMAVHPAFMQPPSLQYPYYAGVTATATALAAAGIPGLRASFLPPNLFTGQPMIPASMAVTQAVTQPQARFHVMPSQQNGVIGIHAPHLQQSPHMHPSFVVASPFHQPPAQPLQQLNQRQSMLLLSAYRVGMLAMETLGRLVHNDRPQTKYARNPPYGEHVIWLLNIAKKLGE